MADSAERVCDPPSLPDILDRPAGDRRREFKYRFGQSVVFGAPVLALQWFGRSLGGPESDRWATLFQALLAGWVVYVAAAGMLSEGVLLLLAPLRMPKASLADLAVASIAIMTYLFALPRLVALLMGQAPTWPSMFYAPVMLLALWTGLRWRHLAKKNSAG
jgi:hypothetical protein